MTYLHVWSRKRGCNDAYNACPICPAGQYTDEKGLHECNE
jgi:hypothetical protein